jgi:hypothetical protein
MNIFPMILGFCFILDVLLKHEVIINVVTDQQQSLFGQEILKALLKEAH